MNKQLSQQCAIERNGAKQTVWLPEEFAEAGRVVRIKENGAWSDGWKVMIAYPGTIDSAVIQERSRDFANHRKATDV